MTAPREVVETDLDLVGDVGGADRVVGGVGQHAGEVDSVHPAVAAVSQSPELAVGGVRVRGAGGLRYYGKQASEENTEEDAQDRHRLDQRMPWAGEQTGGDDGHWGQGNLGASKVHRIGTRSGPHE